jgi:hypothetical protein
MESTAGDPGVGKNGLAMQEAIVTEFLRIRENFNFKRKISAKC